MNKLLAVLLLGVSFLAACDDSNASKPQQPKEEKEKVHTVKFGDAATIYETKTSRKLVIQNPGEDKPVADIDLAKYHMYMTDLTGDGKREIILSHKPIGDTFKDVLEIMPLAESGYPRGLKKKNVLDKVLIYSTNAPAKELLRERFWNRGCCASGLPNSKVTRHSNFRQVFADVFDTGMPVACGVWISAEAEETGDKSNPWKTLKKEAYLSNIWLPSKEKGKPFKEISVERKLTNRKRISFNLPEIYFEIDRLTGPMKMRVFDPVLFRKKLKGILKDYKPKK